MITLNELETQLGYLRSSHYHRVEDDPPDIETAHLFYISREVGVRGIYTFETSPVQTERLLPARPAVYVAEAETAEGARQIHRSLWNLSYAPFIIIRLPDQIRVYTGFSYAYDSDEEGRITEIHDDALNPFDTSERLKRLHEILTDFHAVSIDTGQIWESESAGPVDPEQRVDEHLLRNLKKLGDALKKKGLRDEIAHALIGKYVYLHYLRTRHILSEAWLLNEGIDPASVFKRDATVNGLARLVEILKERFNGRIFPIDFDKSDAPNDSHVSLVASIFMGDEIPAPQTPEIRQLHLDFQAYDFRYIPVETLSAIYEQFIIDRKETRREKGAIYTPEILADYLLSEVEWAKKLKRGMKILDPACGSGVFLVLAYRRLIEKERVHLGRDLTPDELKSILESIYGVEREPDACYVAEFSLILTLLHYLAPRDLHRLQFKLPELHNTQIFECDFFPPKKQGNLTKFGQKGLKFDCIVGNPPWIEAEAVRQKFARTWINRNTNRCPVGDLSVAEAFSWLVTDLLTPDGIIGLILPATSLFNQHSEKYRRAFFTQHQVLRITNFANIEVLFGKDKRDVKPAMTVIYHRTDETSEKREIVHYGPFSANQVSEAKDQPWVITINENEIQTVSPYKAETGDLTVWKFALWGTHLDERAVRRIKKQFPTTLEELKETRGWFFSYGVQLRTMTSKGIEPVPKLKGQQQFCTDKASKSLYLLSVPAPLLQSIPDEKCNIRTQGGMQGLKLVQAPHIVLSSVWQNYIIYSDEDFVIPTAAQMGIAAPKRDADYLKALSVYLHSSLVAFYMFFHAEQWGIYRRARQVSIGQVGKIPVPEFTMAHRQALVALHDKLVNDEKRAVSDFIARLQQNLDPTEENQEPSLLTDFTKGERKLAEEFRSELRAKLQKEIDDTIFALFKIPSDIETLVSEFIDIRLALDDRSTMGKATREPTPQELLDYARELQAELDGFLMGEAYHRVYINQSEHLIECVVEITKENETIAIDEHNIRTVNSTISETLANISDSLREQISQWVYVQRGLRLFDGPRIYIYKAPRLIDWTKTQAITDAGDIIGQAVSIGICRDDNNQAK
jgi:methylase of polypeptide subunit release factors